jgi:hypothetical protein
MKKTWHSKKKEKEERARRVPRVRSAAYRRAVERLDEALGRAEETKSERLRELEYIEQDMAIENLRCRLFGTEIAMAAK